MYRKFIHTDQSKATIIIRLMVGAVFLSEGIQKFLYPAMRGAGRFEGMGFPNPELFANFVGVFEILAGMLLILGFITRGAAFAMLINMTVAIVVTKIPIAFGESFGPFVLRDLNTYGFWSMAHEIRTDFAMWLGALFLIIKGGGKWSIDRLLMKK
ncbi:MAG: DoxX family protein [Bacteroidales bacterium]|nr:DoxX family protein [Bacteroidales bacterium]MBS3776471.1 DoxX family protein [Bacteroidales bacterium]